MTLAAGIKWIVILQKTVQRDMHILIILIYLEVLQFIYPTVINHCHLADNYHQEHSPYCANIFNLQVQMIRGAIGECPGAYPEGKAPKRQSRWPKAKRLDTHKAVHAS